MTLLFHVEIGGEKLLEEGKVKDDRAELHCECS